MASEKRSGRDKTRYDQFRHLVDLRKLDKPKQGVVVDWSKRLEAWAHQEKWEIFFENTWSQDRGAIKEWGLRRTQPGQERAEQLAVKIYVSSDGAEPARRYFVSQAMSSTASDLPYQRPPSEPPEGDVVTFLVKQSRDGVTHNDSLLRLYRNVVFDVSAYDSKSGVFEIADDLLALAQENSNASLDEGRPLVTWIDPKNQREAQVRLPVAPDEFDDFPGLEVQVQTKGNVDFLGFSDRDAKFRQKEELGKGRVRVQAIDRRTLLSGKVDFKI